MDDWRSRDLPAIVLDKGFLMDTSMSDESDKAPELPDKRRWYQYSLRSLMIVMVLLCILFAWGGYKVRQAEKQKDAVAWVEKKGGWATYDFQFDANGEEIFNAQPPGPDWLREWIGIDYFCDVAEVNLSDTQVTNLSPMEGLTNLENLNLANTQVQDLTPLQGLTNLKELDLAETQVKDISPLEGLTRLEKLALYRTKVSDLSPLKGLTNLKILTLGFTQVSDISPLEGLTKLEALWIEKTEVSDLSPLADLTNLTSLNFTYTQVTDLSPLQGLPNLIGLYLYDTPVSEEEVRKLQKALPNCTIW